MRKHHPKRPFLLLWRNRMNWTQEQLANMLGVSHSTVQRQEAGKIGVDDQTFAAIAAAYGITVAELSAHPDDADKAKALHRIYTAAAELDAEALKAAATFMERMKPTG